MPDKVEAPGTAPHRPPPFSPPEKAGRTWRSALGGGTMARGLLLFTGLVVFTLLYALLLQWLSSPGDAGAGKAHAEATAGGPVQAGAGRERPVVGADNAATTATVARAGTGAATSPVFHRIDDSALGAEGFTYSSGWEHIVHRYDGRSGGTSARTYHIGASASLNFIGRRLRVYGVRGPNGGYAELRIDGQTYALLRFYAPRKETNALIYTSPQLEAGPHPVTIVAAQAPDGLPKRRFVNIDGVAYAP